MSIEQQKKLTMKDLDILYFLKLIQENKELILDKVSNNKAYVKIKLDNISFETDAGICGNIWRNFSYSHDIKDEYLEAWKHYSGVEGYPVSGRKVFESLGNFWLGDQAELRFDLIDHLIKCYSEDLEGVNQ